MLTSFLTAIVIVISISSLFIGPVIMPIDKIFSLIFTGGGGVEHHILFDIRLPRIILGIAVGGALGVAGVILQGMFRNPLVDPYTLGISGGAALSVSLCIVAGLHHTFGILILPLSGFSGAIVVILLIYVLSIKKGIIKTHSLLLIGVMISFVSASLIMLVMAVSRVEDLPSIVFWIMGSLEEPNWLLIKLVVFMSILGLILSYLFSLDLNAFSVGEEGAKHLGVNTERTKRILFILASLITGISVAICGVIGFVGLVVPHFMRMFVGSDHRILLISSFLGGAGFLVLCDTLARTIISPMELPVGVITGIVGGSLFIYVLIKKQTILAGN